MVCLIIMIMFFQVVLAMLINFVNPGYSDLIIGILFIVMGIEATALAYLIHKDCEE